MLAVPVHDDGDEDGRVCLKFAHSFALRPAAAGSGHSIAGERRRRRILLPDHVSHYSVELQCLIVPLSRFLNGSPRMLFLNDSISKLLG